MAKTRSKKVEVARGEEVQSNVKMKVFTHDPCDDHPDFG